MTVIVSVSSEPSAALHAPPRADARDCAGTGQLTVSSAPGVAALHRFAFEIDRLNAASARPNPFMSSAFLICYALRSEYFMPGKEERLYLIRDGDRLIGCAPMRRSAIPLLGIRLQWLAPIDTERPGILAAPEDAERAASALVRHLCEHESGWGMVEFVGQPPDAALYRAVHGVSDGRFRARDIHVEPYTEIAVVWSNLADYFRSLVKKMRSNVSRQARRLFASGEPQLVLAEGAAATSAWYDAYCDLDGRSWKSGTASSIARHPRRVRFYRELLAGRAGFEPSFIGVILDGVLMAGLIAGSNASAAPGNHGTWCLEMAYDKSRADLGPGQLLLLLAVGRAIARGDKYLNFMQNFAYYKHRWGAAPIAVANVQLIRRRSVANVRALLGDAVKRWRARKPGARADEMDAAEPARETEDPSPALARPDHERARHLTALALAYDGQGMQRLDRERARQLLPFEVV